MEIAMESTSQLTHMDGVPVRVWRGVTARGVACHVFVHRIAVEKIEDTVEFERDLAEMDPPGGPRTVPLRNIL